ncbi:MAG: GtrA family protein [Candidatus Uhrbacteria bacterium]|nr:GtrA family protein [Candidatus Uhrbacteria bacterium]
MTIFWHTCLHECRKVIRFGIIGFSSWLLYAGGYALLSRILWIDGNRTLENFLATCVSAVFNFFAHRHWTFQSHAMSHAKQFWRYLAVLASAMLFQAGLFWFGHEYLHWYDFAVVFLSAGISAFYTYVMHRFYTFKHAKQSGAEAGI